MRLSVIMGNEAEFNAAIADGVPIAENSHFLYAKHDNGRPYYVGVFFYLSDEGEVSRLLVRLEPRESRGNRGYAGIFGITSPSFSTATSL